MAYSKATHSEYIAWVQRGLNRELGTNLRDSGAAGSAYRDLVTRLNQDYLGSISDVVDVATQNLLVELSNARQDYMSWVQLALHVAGFYKGGFAGTIDSTTRDALTEFQGKSNLRGDAWVGPDTETWLITASGMKPPGQYTPVYIPKPKPTPSPKRPSDFLNTAQRVEQWARTYRHDLDDDSTVDAQRKARMKCVLGKIKSAVVADTNDRYMTASAVRLYLRAPLAKTGTFDAELVSYTDSLKSKLQDYALKCPGSRASSEAYQGFKKAFQSRFDDVERGLSEIQAYYAGTIRDSMMHAAGAKTGRLHRWATRKQSSGNDIYSCFK